MMGFKTILTLVFAISLPLGASAADDLAACYRNAKDVTQTKACLEKEWKAVQAEHKEAVERVASLAKAWDKPYKTRDRWNRFIRASQNFETWTRRECEFVKMTTKGNRTTEQAAELACRINLYRVRIDMLENHYLSSQK